MSSRLETRLAALGEAAELAGGRLEDAVVEPARAVVRRAGERLGHGLEATVVALAGPTGAGKSTLFNALAGRPLVREGVTRPTTSAASAAIFGPPDERLLDWLEVPSRHTLDGGAPDGLVLLDLPDFDSVEAAHRIEVDRLVRLVDLLVWVVDPQKYADAALHERYLRPLAGHAAAMLVVLNQSDRLGADAERARDDLARLLASAGLGEVPVLAASARTGDGLEALRSAPGGARRAARGGAGAARRGRGVRRGRPGRGRRRRGAGGAAPRRPRASCWRRSARRPGCPPSRRPRCRRTAAAARSPPGSPGSPGSAICARTRSSACASATLRARTCGPPCRRRRACSARRSTRGSARSRATRPAACPTRGRRSPAGRRPPPSPNSPTGWTARWPAPSCA